MIRGKTGRMLRLGEQEMDAEGKKGIKESYLHMLREIMREWERRKRGKY